MPFAVLIRLVARLALAEGLRRWMRHAAMRGGPANAPLRGTRTLPDRRAVVLQEAVEGARLLGRVVAFSVVASAFAVLLAAGVTLISLGPRWVGIVLLALAVLALVAAVAELRALLHQRRRWRLRRRDRRLRAGTGQP
jgi:hypothetical protein